MKNFLILLGVTLLVLSLIGVPIVYAQTTVTISGGSATVNEGGTLTYTLTRTPATDETLAVTYSVGFFQAAGPDFTTTSGTITFASDSGEATLNLSIIEDDNIVESNEQFTLTFSSTSDTVTFAPMAEFTITITDNDTATASLSFGTEMTTTATEGTDATVTLTATLDKQVDRAKVTLTLAVTNNTATSGSDYTLNANAITINANTDAGTALISIVNDDVVEQDEIVEIYISALSIELGFGIASSAVINGTDGTDEDSVVTLTITNDDMATVSLSLTSDEIEEGPGAEVTLIATLDQLVDAQVILTLDVTTNSTATLSSDSLPGDYTLTDIMIDANMDRGTASIVIVNDDVVEQDEIVEIFISGVMTAVNDGLPIGVSPRVRNGTDGMTGENPFVTLTILDTDTAEVSLSLGMATVTEAPNATVTLTASLTNRVAAQVILTLDVTNSTATSGSNGDYTLTDITIDANTNEGTTTIVIVNDDVVEQDEIVEIYISGVMTAVNDGLPMDVAPVMNGNPIGTPVTLTIANDDTATVTLNLASNEIEEGVTNATVTLTASLTNQVDAQVILTLDVTNNSTATSDDDYSALPSTITIPANTTSSGNITITIVDDDIVEPDEIVEIYISALSTDPELDPTDVTNGTLETSAVTLTITDNDTATVSLSLTSDEIEEGPGAEVTLIATLTNLVDAQVELTLAATLDSAATSDDDYTLNDIMIAANTNQGTASIAIVNDDIVEQDEIVKIYISDRSVGSGIASSAVINGNPIGTPVTLTITNDDTIQIALSAPSMAGEGDIITVTTTLSGGQLTADLTVTLGSLDSTSPSSAYLATNETDYFFSPAPFTFQNGQRTTTITLLTDGNIEPNETFAVYIDTLALSGFDPATDFVTNNTPEDAPLVVTIIDNDTVSARFARPQDQTFTFSEADGTVSDVITVSLFVGASQTVASPTQLTDDVVVNVTATDRTATRSNDYSFTDLALTFSSTDSALSQSFSLSFSDDTLIETNETFDLSLDSSSDGVNATDVLTITLTDNDFVEVGFDSLSLTVDENEDPLIGLTLTIPDGLTLATTIFVPIETIDSTATASNDYTLINDTIVFDIGNSSNRTFSRTVEITLTDDTVFEQTEQFFLNIVQPENIILALDDNRLLTVVILDDDQSSVTLSIVGISDPDTLIGAEGSTFSLEASLGNSQKAFQTITVFIGTTHATSTLNQSDYSITRAIIIPQGRNSSNDQEDDNPNTNGSLILTDDAILENDEILEIYIQRLSIDGLTIGTPQDAPLAFTITDNDTVSLAFSSNEFIVDEDDNFALAALSLQGISNSERTVVARLDTADGSSHRRTGLYPSLQSTRPLRSRPTHSNNLHHIARRF